MNIDTAGILAALQSYQLQIWGQAMGVFALVAAVQIIYGAIGFLFFGRTYWSSFTYPVVALVLLVNYQDIVEALVGIPQGIGFSLEMSALKEAMAIVTNTVKSWREAGGWLTVLARADVWTVIGKALMVLSVLVTVISFLLLRLAQVCTIGVLYVVGPLFCLAAGFKGTASYTIRWATFVVEASTWSLVWGVLLSGAVAVSGQIPAVPASWTDPMSIVATMANVAYMVLFSVLTLATPFLTRALVGGGIGVITAGATMAMAGQVASTAMSTVSGAVVGGVTGGPGGAALGAAAGGLSSVGMRGLDKLETAGASKKKAA